MTFGDKLSKLRKEQNYTQEQLAELLGVSRQSISKWESDLAYPETEKLIKIGKLFDCSMDYLLKEEITQKDGQKSDQIVSALDQIHATLRRQCRERKSEKTVLGMPLYHIGRDARGFFAIGLRARGIFAIGLRARGIVSLGLLSFGILSIGLLAIGPIALGTLALGLLSVGSVSLGLFAVGAIAIGIVAFGALSVGAFSAGALAIGRYVAVGDHARAMIAIGLEPGHSKAIGNIYRFIGDPSTADLSYINAWLDSHVPLWLSWAKALFRWILF